MKIASRWQPLVFEAMASLALAGFAGYDLYRERDKEVHQAKADTANLARLLEAHTQQSLRRVDALPAVAAASIARIARIASEAGLPGLPPAALQDDLRSLLPADGLVAGLVWLAADGSVLASTLPLAAQAGAASLLQDWQARQQAQPAAGAIVGRLQKLRDGIWQLPMGKALPARPVPLPAPGAVVPLVDPAALQPVFDSVDTGRNGFVSLFLSDGWMLATAPRKESLFVKNWSDSPMFKQHLPQARLGTVQQVVVRDGTAVPQCLRERAAGHGPGVLQWRVHAGQRRPVQPARQGPGRTAAGPPGRADPARRPGP